MDEPWEDSRMTGPAPHLPDAGDLTANDGWLSVRPATTSDAPALFGLIIAPERRHPDGQPRSVDDVRDWIAAEHAWLGAGRDKATDESRQRWGPTVIWVIEGDGAVIGELCCEVVIDLGARPLRDVEYWDVCRDPRYAGRHIADRAVHLIEPVLVHYFGVERVSANVSKDTWQSAGLAAAVACGFGEPDRELPDRFCFSRPAIARRSREPGHGS